MENLSLIGVLVYIYIVLSSVTALPHSETNSQQTLSDEQPITDDTLRKLLVKLSQAVGPSPQVLPAQSISIGDNKVSFNGTADDASKFSTTAAHVNMTTLEFFVGIAYTSLNIQGHYDMYIDNDFIHITGSDAFRVNMSDVSTNMYIKLNLTSTKTLQMEQFDLDYNATIQVEFKNIGKSKKASDTLNYLMNYLIPEIITTTKPLAVAKARELVFQRSKFFLEGMTVEQLISLINTFVAS